MCSFFTTQSVNLMTQNLIRRCISVHAELQCCRVSRWRRKRRKVAVTHSGGDDEALFDTFTTTKWLQSACCRSTN
ncbi:hypothetical protein ATANTOWER_005180 [Ataeniobius toweri]|uniref:Uncharacterized protein n=1 Tax=Ataeniobius toweri TaxID=208326 RepID=A0ABU7A1H9_9TELE|nr:hypothetical protein [Ataeniobius toweri]